MARTIEGFRHQTGEHCASTAIRNVLRFHGIALSEAMVFGLASGLGFFYLKELGSPSRMFHGRTVSLEIDFHDNLAIPFEERAVEDDDQAFRELKAKLDAGEPVMISTDTFYLGYQKTSSHFPGHRCVVVGYEEASESIFIADRKYEEFQRCSFEELRKSRNARDYPMSCENRYGNFLGSVALGRPLEEAILRSMRKTSDALLSPVVEMAGAERPNGIAAMRLLSREFPEWADLDDWSWAARFGYQVVVKRGAGGSFFRSLYADFLREAEARLPELAQAKLSAEMDQISADWRKLAGLLKDQSERDVCEPELFEEASVQIARLADREERFFEASREIAGA